MANWIADTYASAADLETAVESIDNTITVHIVPYKEAGKQKFILVKSA